MVKLNTKYLLFFGLLLIIAGCRKEVVFDPIPKIEYRSFDFQTVFNEHSQVNVLYGQLELYFEDGGGDLGLRDSDTMGDFSLLSPYHYNLFTKIILTRAVPDTVIELDTNLYYGRFPDLTKNGESENIKGDMKVNLALPFAELRVGDLLMYEIHIVDRDLNVSNKIQTEPVIYAN